MQYKYMYVCSLLTKAPLQSQSCVSLQLRFLGQGTFSNRCNHAVMNLRFVITVHMATIQTVCSTSRPCIQNIKCQANPCYDILTMSSDKVNLNRVQST
jgi:hypothetical protein